MPTPAPAPPAREVPFGEVPTGDLHAGLTEDFKRWALEACTPQSLVLDAGCGEGRVAFFLAPHAKRVVAVDKDAKAIEAGKQRARQLGLANVEFHGVDAERGPLAPLVPGGAELVVANLFLSKAVVERAHDALRAGGAFVFTGFGPRQWQEARGSPFAHTEADVRGWLAGAHFKVEDLKVEDTRVKFREIAEVRSYLGEDTVQKWLGDGRWDALVASFQKSKTLTESRLTGRARR
ncbi:MAG TPA: class I SAM-dependent methyltransferase [Candidatus Thermoplasmatota archaeon]|jgi:SAM-dependent methyltransferase|nr:class I SAM-dependent methyltransferase [Candidatus Thermoplasmatota archaeon]